ncbi:MAG: hypothetical protein AB1700_16525, partial [Bacillota bacterium]
MLTDVPATTVSNAGVELKAGSAAARSPWRDRDRVLTAGSVLFFFAALGYTRGVLPLHVKSLHGSDVAVGLVAAASPAGEIAMRWVSAPLLGKYGPRVIMLWCTLCLACISLAFGVSAAVPLVAALALLHGASVGGF